MEALVALLQGLAFLALVLAGLLMIVGLNRARDHLFRIALLLVGLSLLVPYAVAIITRGVRGMSCDVSSTGIAVSPGIVTPVLLGHLALAFVLLRRRLRRGERARIDANEGERVRGRERRRLPPEG